MKVGQKVYLKLYDEMDEHWAIPPFEWETLEIDNPHTITEIITTNSGRIGIALESSFYHFPTNAFKKPYCLPDDLFEI